MELYSSVGFKEDSGPCLHMLQTDISVDVSGAACTYTSLKSGVKLGKATRSCKKTKIAPHLSALQMLVSCCLAAAVTLKATPDFEKNTAVPAARSLEVHFWD